MYSFFVWMGGIFAATVITATPLCAIYKYTDRCRVPALVVLIVSYTCFALVIPVASYVFVAQSIGFIWAAVI